jgi:hypothetical protein
MDMHGCYQRTATRKRQIGGRRRKTFGSAEREAGEHAAGDWRVYDSSRTRAVFVVNPNQSAHIPCISCMRVG